MFNAYTEEVIITHLAIRGKGIEGDPIRRVIQIWRKDGTLLAEKEEWWEEHKGEEIDPALIKEELTEKLRRLENG